MAYFEQSISDENRFSEIPSLSSKKDLYGKPSESFRFYEIEPAVVIDAIYDENSPAFKKESNAFKVKVEQTPGVNKDGDIDYTWIGRIKVRLLHSQQKANKDNLHWIRPLNQNDVREIPLINEVVLVAKYLEEYYYINRLGVYSYINNNAYPSLEKRYGFSTDNGVIIDGGKKSKITPTISSTLGKYFHANPRVHPLKHYEGDTILESRFGSSIRFGCFVGDSSIDSGNSLGYGDDYTSYGNPSILIRNRQKNLGDPFGQFNRPCLEDINLDGSSIHITSGKTKSAFLPTVIKTIFPKEETSVFSGKGSEYPSVLDGNQQIFVSDRIIFSARLNEIYGFGKKKISFCTDGELTLDSEKQLVITSNEMIVLNSKDIHLGNYTANTRSEPVLLGTSTLNWLSSTCDLLRDCFVLLKEHIHKCPDGITTPPVSGNQDTLDSFIERINGLQSVLKNLSSNKVFIGEDGK